MFVPPHERIVETKKCRISGQEFFVTDKDLEFYDKVSPVFGEKKYSIPTPTLCPEERQKRRLSFRNERKLYKRKCDKTGKEIISIYSPDSECLVYDQQIWWTDQWSAIDHGRDFDFEKDFFGQFTEFRKQVPHPHNNIGKSENCDYCNYMFQGKNNYLSFASSWSENILYLTHSVRSRDTMDCSECDSLEDCYELVDSEECHHCYKCVFCKNCSECYASFDLSGCNHCLFCTNLKNKEYHVNNHPVKKEHFEALYTKFLGNYDTREVQVEFLSLIKKSLHRPTRNFESEECLGSYLRRCKNCVFCTDLVSAENCRYSDMSAALGQHDSMDCSGSMGELCYESHIPFMSYSVIGTDGSMNVKNAYYSALCLDSENIFGCIGLRSHMHHCILNKPYSVSEYEKLAGKIIDHMRSTGEWGEFFPHELSPFGYNETVAQEYFPMTEEEVRNMPRFSQWRFREPPFGRGTEMQNENRGIYSENKSSPLRDAQGTSFKKEVSRKGWNWYNEPPKTFEGTSLTPLPISQYDEKQVGYEEAQKNIDALLNGIVQCEITKKPFKIIKQELVFYIEHQLPIPTKHPDQRHKERMSLRNPRELHERNCAECGKSIITTYSPNRSERVVCEECYRKLVY